MIFLIYLFIDILYLGRELIVYFFVKISITHEIADTQLENATGMSEVQLGVGVSDQQNICSTYTAVVPTIII